MAKPALYGPLFNNAGGLIPNDQTPVFLSGPRPNKQTPTEAVLVSGVDATIGTEIEVTLTAARLVGAPLNLSIGLELLFTLIEGGAGGFAVTWAAIFKAAGWSNVGNVAGAAASMRFWYDGTFLRPVAAQSPFA